MMSTKILLSVIVPVYNVATYLNDCLDSLLDQGFAEDEYEIICVDDGSTDSSLLIIQEYAQKNSCIKCIHQENAGVSAARNKGLDIASGAYVAFVDGDDCMVSNALKILCDEAMKRDSDTMQYGYSPVEEELSYCPKGDFKFEFARNLTGVAKSTANVCSSLVKREIIEKNGIRFPNGIKYGEDTFFAGLVSMFVNADKQFFCSAPVYCYRQRKGSAMHTNGNEKHVKHMDDMLRMIDEYSVFYAKNLDLNDKRKRNVKMRLYLCSAAALFDALRVEGINEYDVRNELIRKEAYPYPFIPYIVRRKINLSNIIMLLLKYRVVFFVLAKTKVLKGR